MAEGSSSAKTTTSTSPWVERYRPSTITQVAHQDEVISTLSNALTTGNLPHLLFYGPPGTGKTSTILALAKDLFGHEHYKTRVLELNASDERGIDVVRTKIKNFASLAVSTTAKSGNNACPPFKLIVLDEADCMTSDAQSALRRTMEKFTRVTRFCIICNYVSRIIGPIASRCAKFRFQPLSHQVMASRLQQIADSESFALSSEAKDALISVSGGDLRKAITLMQNCYLLHGSSISAVSVTNAAAVVPAKAIDDLMNACRSNSFDKVQNQVMEVLAEGYPANQVILQLLEYLMSEKAACISSDSKALICAQLAAMDKIEPSHESGAWKPFV